MAVSRMPGQLMDYWSHGEGAAKIKWGVSGDFDRCVRLVQEAIVKGGGAPLPDSMIKGLCATIHKRTTGAVPGQAPGEKK